MMKLTFEICDEYRKKALSYSEDNPLQIGLRKELTREFQEKYQIPEIWAANIINGRNTRDYIAIQIAREKKEREEMENPKKSIEQKIKDLDDWEYLEELAEAEERKNLSSLILLDERKNS